MSSGISVWIANLIHYICLDSEFDTLEDVKTYSAHPDHQAAAGLLKGYKQDRACVDYML